MLDTSVVEESVIPKSKSVALEYQFVEGELHGQGTFIGATGEQYEGETRIETGSPARRAFSRSMTSGSKRSDFRRLVGGLRRLCGGFWYILYPLRGPTCNSCKISSKAEILKLDPSVAIIILG